MPHPLLRYLYALQGSTSPERRLRVILSVLLTLFFLFPRYTPAASAPARSAANPLYSTYDFGTSPSVINFGIQPLAVPIGVLTEVIKRDRILRQTLARKGFELRFHPFMKGDDMIPFVVQGKIDVAMSGDMPTIRAASSADIVVAALAKQGFSSIIAGKHMPVSGLKGKRIAYPSGSNGHYALLAALSSNGLDESDVRMIPMEVSEMVDALGEGRVDAFVAWEPVTTMAAAALPDSAAIYRHLNSSYLFFTRKLARRDPEAASALVASMVRALGWLGEREENLLLAAGWTRDAGTLLGRKPVNLSVEEMAGLILKEIVNLAPHPTIPERDLTDRGSIRKELDFLKSRGLIPSSVGAARILQSFDRSIISSVVRNPRKYRLDSFDYDDSPARSAGPVR